MRLQSFGVIFVVIIVPLILVLSYYLNLQIKTITKQNEYDNDLLSATYDAMSSFEINTANEDLSSVSDSLRTIIEASCNVFTNSLATNLGMSNASKSILEPFLPAVLYTLYDGYYIYSPTKVPTVVTDESGNAVCVGDPGVSVSSSVAGTYTYTRPTKDPTTGIIDPSAPKIKYSDPNFTNKEDFGQQLYIYENDAQNSSTNKNGDSNLPCTTQITPEHTQMKIKNVLKTYMPYSAKYKQGDINVTIVYTLDNYVSIEGTIGNVYYTKSGYLIPIEDGSGNKIINATLYDSDGNADSSKSIFNFNQADAKKYIADGNKVDLTLKYSKGDDTSEFLEVGDSCTISVGNKPVELTKIEGDFEVKETITYLYRDPKDVTDGDTPFDQAKDAIGYSDTVSSETEEVRNKYNYYNYEELERRIVKLNNAYDDANVFLNKISKDTSYNPTTDADLSKYIDNNKKDGFDTSITTDSSKDSIAVALRDFQKRLTTMINNRQSFLDKASAVQYYVDSYIFSSWIQENLGNLKESSIIDIEGLASFTSINGSEEVLYEFLKRENSNVFDLSRATKSLYEITSDSTFYTHKTNVIRNSIQYNLNMAMTTYNNVTASTYEYAMPVLNSEEWEKILTNVSIVSFMQGYSCGLKTYNNYMIVTSSNNEITVNPDDIYYVKKSEFNDENTKYHKIDCKELYNKNTDNDYLSFTSKESKYDKLYDRNNKTYLYDHRNLACYYCINDKNYFDESKDVFRQIDYEAADHKANDDKCKNLQYAYYIAVGKERNNLYKMNAFTNSQGYEIIYMRAGIKPETKTYSGESSLGANKVKSIQITINPLKFKGGTPESVINFAAYTSRGGTPLSETNSSFYTINYSSTISTFNIDVNPNISHSSTLKWANLQFKNQRADSTLSGDNGLTVVGSDDISETLRNYTLCVKIIYK